MKSMLRSLTILPVILLFTLWAWSAAAEPPKAAPPVMAPEAGMVPPPAVAPPAVQQPQQREQKDHRDAYVFAIMGIMASAVLGGTLGLAIVGAKVVGGIVRNPGARPAIMPLLLLSMALVESVVIYGLVVTVLLYAKL